MPDYPKRKRNRLSAYDYSTPGAYFVTICTHEKRCILSSIAVGALHEAPVVRLTKCGEIVQQYINALPLRFPELEINNYVIMPNHIHLIVHISAERALREAPLRDSGNTNNGGHRSLLSKSIGYLKMNSAKQIHQIHPNMTVWQRSFHDHVIRSEKDYDTINAYVAGNPAKWTDDCFYPGGQI